MQFKCPEDYDFSNKSVDWKSYANDYTLRTDAVWEKLQLLDVFRLSMKAFWFNASIQKYMLLEPEDLMTIHHEGWAIEEYEIHEGFTNTGRTNSYQISLPPRQEIETSTAVHAVSEDYYELCGMRFEQWHKCDMVYYDERDQYDQKVDNAQAYPCYREFYEAQYSCSDDIFEFLMEISQQRKANGFFQEQVANYEVNSNPTIYDTPEGAERKTYTY